LLRIHMTDDQLTSESFPKDKILGGRATIDYLILDELSVFTSFPHPLHAKGRRIR
jgi:hypothetical protein